MLDEFDDHQGASGNLDDRLKGELLATYSELKARYQTTRLELAWSAISMLLKHIEDQEGLEALIEFSEKAGAMISEDAKDIHAILDDDHRRRAH
jgi:hypothetical protein